jgi:hypothetical protein
MEIQNKSIMKNIFTLFILVAASHFAVGQCTSAIPSTAVIVNSAQSLPANGGAYWVCPGGALSLTGNNNIIFVETGGYASINGTNNTINSKTVVNSTSEDGFGVNIIYVSNPDHALSQNMDDQINGCSQVVFNYNTAPAGGCAGGMGIADNVDTSLLEIFPNPVQSDLHIVAKSEMTVETVRILDIRGRIVIEQPGKKEMMIDLLMIPAGVYTVIVDTNQGELVRRVRKDQ